MTTPALGRAIARGLPGRHEDRCDMCAAVAGGGHRHALDTARGELMCLCRACALLFQGEAAARGHYRLVPQRRVRACGVIPAALGVPVGLAYFTVAGDGSVAAHYPSPAGSARCEVDSGVWQSQVACCPELAGLAPDVEALLVNTVRGAHDSWLVGIDDCFALIALIGREWTGLTGGSRVWTQVEEFFATLRDTAGEEGNRVAGGSQ